MKFILASHGRASEGLLDTVNMLLGPQEEVEAYVLLPEEEPERLGERLRAAFEGQDEGDVVFFTDLFHGSPFNQVVELSRAHDLYHVTGMNVPVLIEALVARNAGATAAEVCERAVAAAADSVRDVRKLMDARAASDQMDSNDEEEF